MLPQIVGEIHFLFKNSMEVVGEMTKSLFLTVLRIFVQKLNFNTPVGDRTFLFSPQMIVSFKFPISIDLRNLPLAQFTKYAQKPDFKVSVVEYRT